MNPPSRTPTALAHALLQARHSGELTMFWKDDQGATLTASKTITVG